METEVTAPAEKWAYLDLLGLVQRRKGRIALGVFAGVALAAAACAVIGPWYEASARLLVIRKRLDTTPLSGAPQGHLPEDYLSTHILIITSPKIVGRAIENGDLAKLAGLGDKEEPARAILDSLQVTRDPPKPGVVPSNEILNLSFRGRFRDDCGRVLESIITSYQEFLQEAYRNRSAEALELIRRAKDEGQKDLEVKQAAYRAFLQKSPQFVKGKDGKSPQEERLLEIDARLAAGRVRRAEVESALAAVDKVRRGKGTDGEMLQVLAAVRSDREAPAPAFLRHAETRVARGIPQGTLGEELAQLQLQEGKLLEEWGADHPEVRSTRARIEHLRSLLVPMARTPGMPPRGGARERELVAVKLELLKQDLNEAKRAEKVFEELFEHEQGEAKAAALLAIEDGFHRKRIEQAEVLYDSIIKQLKEIDATRDYGSFDTYVLAAPQRGRWVIKKVLLVFGLGLLGGLLAGLAWAGLSELTDTSLRRPEEVGSLFNVPVLGNIPVATAARETADPILSACCRPDSSAAEAYRGVRTALYVRTRTEGGKVIQVTSPDPGDGKTTVAANLAASVALSGRKVLLIDADFRSPRLEKAYGMSAEVGLSSLLRGTAVTAEAVRRTEVEGLSILASGSVPPNPAEVLASPHLRALFREVAAAYDFVFVDTPPLLAVTDAMVVAAEADAVLLTVPLAKNGRPRAKRAKEILETAGARVLGVVVSRFENDSGG